ncbi:hypothetical protein F2Q70_00037017 [Brassica cretica]|uniref:Uncharacterized protein n=1 Tax=Brassica cretica TaxID=69181 RepID=A0A8S9JSK1_BRACR|nr:hypothetical protein F2Q70_00037017 [Brassica cretica]
MQHQKVLMMMYLWSILTISFSKKKKEASYSAATHQKELLEQAIWESNQQHYGHDIASKSEGTETGKVLPCALSHSKKNASPKVLSFQVAYAEFQDNYASLSLLPTKYALWNLFHQVLSNTEDIQSSAVDLLTYTSQAGLFESHTRFTVLNDVDETGNEPMSSLSLTKGGEQG